MLARATHAEAFVVNDVRTFKLKADRHMRRLRDSGEKPVRFIRCRTDLKDFVATGSLEELAKADAARLVQTSNAQSAAAASRATSPSFVGIGKHLCGAASDFALRALVEQGCRPSDASGSAAAARTPAATDGGATGGCVGGNCAEGDHSHGNGTSQAKGKDTGKSVAAVDGGEFQGSRGCLEGVCIATCCHHRCTWQAYVGKYTMRQLGFDQREFEMLSWMAGACLEHFASPSLPGGAPDKEA
jgi:hypothetical protein